MAVVLMAFVLMAFVLMAFVLTAVVLMAVVVMAFELMACVCAQVSSIIISSKTTQGMPPHTKSSPSDLGTWLCRLYDDYAGLISLH